MIAMKKSMKDIIRTGSLHLFKQEFLERSEEEEMRRRKAFKELTGLGMRPYQAYQMSLRRMKI
jgi:hypothetical protein